MNTINSKVLEKIFKALTVENIDKIFISEEVENTIQNWLVKRGLDYEYQYEIEAACVKFFLGDYYLTEEGFFDKTDGAFICENFPNEILKMIENS